jgi:hypothetical protein
MAEEEAEPAGIITLPDLCHVQFKPQRLSVRE